MLESIAYLSLADTFLRWPPPFLVPVYLPHALPPRAHMQLPTSWPTEALIFVAHAWLLLVFTSIMLFLSASYVIAHFLVNRTLLAACARSLPSVSRRSLLSRCAASLDMHGLTRFKVYA